MDHLQLTQQHIAIRLRDQRKQVLEEKQFGGTSNISRDTSIKKLTSKIDKCQKGVK